MILPHEKAKWLSPEKQKWIETVLCLWGAWEFSGLDDRRKVNMIYKFMMSVEAEQLSKREQCCDEFGLLMNCVIHVVTKGKIHIKKYIEAKYVFGISERKIAISMRNQDESKRGLRHWQDLVQRDLRETEKLIADLVTKSIQSHRRANYLKKYAFKC